MYRLLEVGEVIEKGDEYWWSNRWNPIVPSCFGCKVKLIDSPIRRLAKPAVTPAASSVPAPVVSVGDRVKVLSGPWAGCTGVVTGFEVEVSLSGYGKMTALKDSVPVVMLDNVHVGGQRLNVKESKVEKLPPLPPVVPEVLYRDLSHGETIREGDEFRMKQCSKWEPAKIAVGDKFGSNSRDGDLYLFRRPVRLQSPGWRYLDAGEPVQSGDQVWCQTDRNWLYLLIMSASKVTNDKLFRRKLPANQGC